MPRLGDLFGTAGSSSAKIYTTLYLATVFWQIHLDPKTRHKTSFIAHQGISQFWKLSFGPMNSPMTFQLAMTHTLRGMNWTLTFINLDDILILGQHFEEHLYHLEPRKGDTLWCAIGVGTYRGTSPNKRLGMCGSVYGYTASKYPLVLFGSEGSALTLPLFLLLPRIIMLCHCSSTMTKDHFC